MGVPNEFKGKGDAFLLPPLENSRSAKTYWHTTQVGFGVRVGARTRAGAVSRIYVVRIVKTVDGKRQDDVLPLGDVQTTDYDTASKRASDLHYEKKQSKKSGKPTTPKLARAWEIYKELKSSEWRAATLLSYEKKYKYCADVADTFIDMLGPEWWDRRLKKLSETSGRATAAGVYRLWHAVYGYMITLERAEKNPLAHLTERYGKRLPAARPKVEEAKLPALWTYLQQHAYSAARDYVLIVLMTGWRRSVVSSLRWEHYDHEKGTYHLGAQQVGNKSGVPFDYPLPKLLLELVFHPRYADHKSEWILPSPKRIGRQLRCVRGTLKRFQKDTGAAVSPHRLRRTFAGIAEAATNSPLMVSRLLTHSLMPSSAVIGAVSQLYLETEMRKLRAAANKTATLLMAYLNGKAVAFRENSKLKY